MENQLIKSLQTVPAFDALVKTFFKTGTDNYYVEHFLAANDNSLDYEYNAKERLVDDNSGYFDEWIHDDVFRHDVTEFMRAIFREVLKCQ